MYLPTLAPQAILAITLLLPPTLAHPAPLPFAHEVTELVSIYEDYSRDTSLIPREPLQVRAGPGHRRDPSADKQTPKQFTSRGAPKRMASQFTILSPKDDSDHDDAGAHTWTTPGFISKIPPPRFSRIREAANAWGIGGWRHPEAPQTAFEKKPTHAGGVIRMGSSLGHHIPLDFAMSRETCPQLANECGCMIDDLSTLILAEYPDGVAFSLPTAHCAIPSATITETVRTEIHGRDYRATLELNLKGRNHGVHEMGRNEFHLLVGLLEKTARALWRDVLKSETSFGFLGMKGTVEDVTVDAKWVFYEVQRGVARRCL